MLMLLVLWQFLTTNRSSAAECDEFFHGESFPMTKDTFNRGLVKGVGKRSHLQLFLVPEKKSRFTAVL